MTLTVLTGPLNSKQNKKKQKKKKKKKNRKVNQNIYQIWLPNANFCMLTVYALRVFAATLHLCIDLGKRGQVDIFIISPRKHMICCEYYKTCFHGSRKMVHTFRLKKKTPDLDLW